MNFTAFIGRECGKDQWEYVICHSEGEPDLLGRVLKRRYRTRDKIDALLAGGDIQSIGDTPEETVRMPGATAASTSTDYEFWYRLESNSVDYAYVFSRGRWVCIDGYLLDVDIP